jgi:hypothetical protein
MSPLKDISMSIESMTTMNGVVGLLSLHFLGNNWMVFFVSKWGFSRLMGDWRVLRWHWAMNESGIDQFWPR